MIYGSQAREFNDHFNDDPADWTSYMPSLGFKQLMTAEGFDMNELASMVQGMPRNPDGSVRADDPTVTVVDYLNLLAANNLIESIRFAVGQVAVTVGYLRNMNVHVEGIFDQTLGAAAKAVDVFSQIINNKYLSAAINGVSWVPWVGWALKIIHTILKLIIRIADYFHRKAMRSMERDLAKRFLLPVYDPDEIKDLHDEVMMRGLLMSLQGGRIQDIFRPRFPAPSPSDIEAMAATIYDGDKYRGTKIEDRATHWYLRSRGDLQRFGAMGFIPGTSSVLNLIEFTVGRCGAVPRNIGEYLTTVQMTSAYMWQNVVVEGPSLFSVEADLIRKEWVDYVHSALVFAVESLVKGYTCSTTAGYDLINRREGLRIGRDSDEEFCGPWTHGFKTESGKGECTKYGAYPHWGQMMKIPGGRDHADEFVRFIIEMFWGQGAEQKNFPLEVRDPSRDDDWPDNFFYENTNPAIACRNLRDRQEAVLKSLNAFYVHPLRNVSREGDEITPYPALANDSRLKRKWEENVTAMLNQTDDWRYVYMPDVPEESPLRQILLQKGVPAVPTLGGIGPPRVKAIAFGDVEPPPPPEQSGMNKVPGKIVAVPAKPKPPKEEWSTAKKLAAGAAVGSVALLAYRYDRSRKRYFDQGVHWLRRRVP